MINDFLERHFDVLDSTQSKARELIINGVVGPGHVITVDRQMAGRGRRANVWFSNRGDIALSIILQPIAKSIQEYGQVSYIACIAVANTIINLCKEHKVKHNVACKWVNDILVDEKKIAGVLLEKVEYEMLVVGIGINVVDKISSTIPNITSLYQEGLNIKKEEVIRRLLEEFKELYNTWYTYDFISIRNMWLSQCCHINKQVQINMANGEKHTGTFIGVDDIGAALVVDFTGNIREFLSGDLFFK